MFLFLSQSLIMIETKVFIHNILYHIFQIHFKYLRENFMNATDFLKIVSGFIWGNGLIFLLLFTGLLFTVKLGFIQFRFIPQLVRSVKDCGKSRENGGISQLKTVCMSLGTAMGTGNITGVASAIAIGGAGAVFWMWVSAFFGMAIVYSENYLALKYRRSGECTGPMAYLKYGLGSNVLAAVFAVFCIIAALGMGGMVQVSSFASALNGCCRVSPYITGGISFILIYLVIKGGADRIGSAAQALLPLVTAVYTIISLTVIFTHKENIIPVFTKIFTEAFEPAPVAGGAAGFAVSRAVSAGIRRGIFSNEAGLGSSPILHSAAENGSPSMQGMWSMFEVFFDTIICCTITALVILTAAGESLSVSGAFSTVLGRGADAFLTVSMGIFAFCTIIGWYYCGETAFSCIFSSGEKSFCLLFSAFSALGAVVTPETVFILSDIFNGLMAFPNLAGLLLLSNKVKKE